MFKTCPSGVLLWTLGSSLSRFPFPPFMELAAKVYNGTWADVQQMCGSDYSC